MRVLILAAGKQERWKESARRILPGYDTPKQLVDIGGEPLLRRTARQVRKFGVRPTVVTHDPQLSVPGAQWFEPADCSTVLASWLSTRELWSVRTVLLLGDVYYTRETMRTIMECRDPLRVFGRTELQGRIAGRYYEIFAISYDQALAEQVEAQLRELVGSVCQDKDCKLRTFYDDWCGFPSWKFQHDDTVIYPVNDLTEDFDLFEDYQQFETMIIKQGKLDDGRHQLR